MVTGRSYEELLSELKLCKRKVAEYISIHPNAHPDIDETARKYENQIILLNKAIVAEGHTQRYLMEVWGYSEGEFKDELEEFNSRSIYSEFGWGVDIYFTELNARPNRAWNDGLDRAEYSDTNDPEGLRKSRFNTAHNRAIYA